MFQVILEQSIEVEALWPISCLLADYLDLPQHVTDNIEACVLNHDMTRPVSKTAIYRRWQETGVPPTLYDIVGMYVVGLGRLQPRFREAMARHGQTWLMWEGDMRPTFAARMGSERSHDAPIRWDGNVTWFILTARVTATPESTCNWPIMIVLAMRCKNKPTVAEISRV